MGTGKGIAGRDRRIVLSAHKLLVSYSVPPISGYASGIGGEGLNQDRTHRRLPAKSSPAAAARVGEGRRTAFPNALVQLQARYNHCGEAAS